MNIFEAIDNDDSETVRAILEKPPDLEKQPGEENAKILPGSANFNGMPPIHAGTDNGYMRTARLLTENGVDIHYMKLPEYKIPHPNPISGSSLRGPLKPLRYKLNDRSSLDRYREMPDAFNKEQKIKVKSNDKMTGEKTARPKTDSAWVCGCGTNNSGNFCTECGSPKPLAWECPNCHTVNNSNFCVECGTKRPRKV